jgi:branched-chain amino acid transport system permease protein
MTTVASSLAERSPRINVRRLAILAGLAAAVTVPLVGNDYWLNSIIIPTIVMGLAGLGLNLLTAYAGLEHFPLRLHRIQRRRDSWRILAG